VNTYEVLPFRVKDPSCDAFGLCRRTGAALRMIPLLQPRRFCGYQFDVPTFAG